MKQPKEKAESAKTKKTKPRFDCTRKTCGALICLGAAVNLYFFAARARAQTGGNFNLSHAVVASGGGSSAAGGALSIDGTSGQALAGTISAGGSFTLRGGFWAFQALAPTAATVAVSGRVLSARGQGIKNAAVRLTGADGAVRFATTGAFGYFRFADVAVGETYILEVSSKKFTFPEPTRVLSVQEEIADADFIAREE